MGGTPSPGAVALTVALVLGAVVAFVQTQILKAEEPPARALRFDERLVPGCRCGAASAKLSVRLSNTQRLRAEIVDEEGDPVRTLASDSLRGAGASTFTWTGRDDAGAVVPDGEYRLELDLTDPERSIVIPKPIEVSASRAPPR